MSEGQSPGLTTAAALASQGTGRRDEAHVTTVGAEVDEQVRKALAFVLRSTQAKPQSEAEVRAKLRERDVPDHVADEALAHARRLGAVDDAALARAWVVDRGLDRGYGSARLREELERKGVPGEAVAAALALLADRDERAAAAELAERRRAQLPEGLSAEALARRLAGYLARRGYPRGLAEQVAVEVSGLRTDWD